MSKKFTDYQLSSEILKALNLLDYTEPTKVQEKVIPEALNNKDLVVMSQTGSGKTASFAIPTIEQIDWLENKPQVLVMTPTRELAMQVGEDFFNIGRFKRLKVASVYGKASFNYQQQLLKQKTHIVVGTPGRILDHLDQETLDLSKVTHLIIDEADEMFNMGFIDDIETIISMLPTKRQTMLFSATLPQDVINLTKRHMSTPSYIEMEDENLVVENIDQFGFETTIDSKMDLLIDTTIVESPDRCIIFANTRDQVDEIYETLKTRRYRSAKIHGGMEQKDRTKIMTAFKEGKFRYLVATDVAARGIDVDHITHIINYDVPFEKESYVHRIGRTARLGDKGKAITFMTSDEADLIDEIQNYIKAPIKIKDKPSQEQVRERKSEFEEKKQVKPQTTTPKDVELSKNITKLHINAGRKTKMRPTDVVGALSNLDGMSADDIGVIDVLDISTFVEILNGKGLDVLHQLQTTPIKGRIRTVSIADEE